MDARFRYVTLGLLLLTAVRPAVPAQQSDTTRAAAAARFMESARATPGALLAFLRELPKGGDLHTHLSGAVYAESFIGWAAEQGACIRLADLSSVAPPCDSVRGMVPATDALRSQGLYDRIVDAWSMRNWRPETRNGHHQFFGSFAKFSYAGHGRGGDMLAEVVRRAASNRVSYLEIMDTPADGASALAARVGWDADLNRLRDKLRAAGHAEVVTAARREYARMVARQRALMRCDSAGAEPGCSVPVRFLYQVLRGRPPEQVFAQILTAFEVATADSLVVGFNLVMPEDGYLAMRDFSLHMSMIDHLHARYPAVRISLHAGELTRGLVPPDGLRFHIRESVLRGHARRIGHGVAVMYEDQPFELLRLMADRDVAVEICLTSNAGILGVRGRDHPLSLYHAYGVPTMLATDDEGVSRSDMTMEYMRAVEEQRLAYPALKAMARNSLAHAFVQDRLKTQLLERLERDFAGFEAKWGSMPMPVPRDSVHDAEDNER